MLAVNRHTVGVDDQVLAGLQTGHNMPDVYRKLRAAKS